MWVTFMQKQFGFVWGTWKFHRSQIVLVLTTKRPWTNKLWDSHLRIVTGGAQLRFPEVGRQPPSSPQPTRLSMGNSTHHGARSVPDRCPISARSVPDQCPMGFFDIFAFWVNRRKEEKRKPYSGYLETRIYRENPSGTDRALIGHWSGTDRAPIGHWLGFALQNRSENALVKAHFGPSVRHSCPRRWHLAQLPSFPTFIYQDFHWY